MLRRAIQTCSTLLANAYWKAFFVFGLYQGSLKALCVPIFNCYACPLAVVACPIGTIQYFFTLGEISFYAWGVIILVGVLVGKMACGWLCPFGLFQDLLYKIPLPKLRISAGLHYLKYLILLVFVILLPFIMGYDYDAQGRRHLSFAASAVRQEWFCKLICPAGTLEGGIPFAAIDRNVRLMLYDTTKRDKAYAAWQALSSSSLSVRQGAITQLRELTGHSAGYQATAPALLRAGAVKEWQQWLKQNDHQLVRYKGWLFVWKVFLLGVLLILMIMGRRFFCRVICPLGAIFGLFNWVSGVRLSIDRQTCISCDRCLKNCPMGIETVDKVNSPECIRCLTCTKVCQAIRTTTIFEGDKKPAEPAVDL